MRPLGVVLSLALSPLCVSLSLDPSAAISFARNSFAFVTSLTFALEAYTRLPPRLVYGQPLPELANFTESSVFILFPGAGGPDANTDLLLANVIAADRALGLERHALVFDWSIWRGNLLRASFDSQVVGRQLGKLLRARPSLQHIHVVGVSVGAFAADALVKTVKASGASSIQVHLTLLDPFCSRGVIPNKFGEKCFGIEADFCEHFLNTDDPVPFTNSPVRAAHVFDVTGSTARRTFTPLPGDNMHSWPVRYYGINWKTRTYGGRPATPDHTLLPRGALTARE